MSSLQNLRFETLPARCVVLAAFVAAALGGFNPAYAEEQPEGNMLTPSAIGPVLDITHGTSLAIRLDWPVENVSIANDATADVQVITPNQIIVVGKELGSTNLIVWGENDEVWATRVRVEVDLPQFNEDLNRLFPGIRLEAAASQDIYVVRGTLERAAQVEQLHRYLDVGEFNYVDMTSLAGLQQVQIQVRVAEVNRNAIRKLGINGFQTGRDVFGASLIGPDTGGQINPIDIGVPGGALAQPPLPFQFTAPVGATTSITALLGLPRADLELFLQALKENQYVKVLAEPTLVALSGEEASFLAGGEFPIPVAQTGNAFQNSITVEFKEFGVRLRFRPVVLGDSRISLDVEQEVSDVSNIGAVELQGFRIPSILTRRSETTLELNNGQSFAMAGMLNHSVDARKSRVPLLGDLPVLGALFRSVSYQEGETELVVLVTASLVEPSYLDPEQPLPGDLHVRPNDWDLMGMGNIEGSPREEEPEAVDETSMSELKDLKGPGAWATFHEAPDVAPNDSASKR